MPRLNVALGHWPEVLKIKRDCVVSSKYRHVHHIPWAQGRHESSVRYSHWKVHLCVHNYQQCFQSTIPLWNFGGSLFYVDGMFASLFSLHLCYCIHIYLCFTELNMLFVYTLYQCSFIFMSLASYCSVYCKILLLSTTMSCVSCMSI